MSAAPTLEAEILAERLRQKAVRWAAMGDSRLRNVYRELVDDLDAGRIAPGAAMKEIKAYYEHSSHPVSTHEPML